jgi:hypothetical protein
LEVQRGGRFQFTVRLAKPLEAEAGRVTVRAGDIEQVGGIARGERELTLQPVELPQGPLTLSAQIRVEGAVSGPHQVVVASKMAN